MDETISGWTELVSYLEANHREVRTHPGDHCRFAYDFDGVEFPFGVYLLRTSTGALWITLNTRICPVEDFRTRSALVANTDLPIGGFCLIPDHAALQQSLPLQGLTVENLEHTVRSMATLRSRLQAVARLDDADIEIPYSYVFR